MPIYLLLLGLAILGSYGFVIIRKGNPNGKLFIRVILVTIFTVVIGKQAWSFYQFDQEFNQHAKTVHELIPIYQTLLVLDARFESVKVMGTTAGNGSLMFAGSVRSLQDKSDLEKVVEETKPPIGIAWAVQIQPDAETMAKQ